MIKFTWMKFSSPKLSWPEIEGNLSLKIFDNTNSTGILKCEHFFWLKNGLNWFLLGTFQIPEMWAN